MGRPLRSLRWFLFSFRGRIGRLAYWAYAPLAHIVIFGLLLAIGTFGEGGGAPDLPKGMLEAIFLLFPVLVPFFAWTNYAVHAKRWHDRGKSGWWSLIGFVPYLGLLWILVECGFLRGTEGPNRFGDDPDPGRVAKVFD